jgi:hypothetical protein
MSTFFAGQLSNPEFNATKNLLPQVYTSLIEKGMMQGGRTRQIKVDVCVSDDDTVSRQLLNKLDFYAHQMMTTMFMMESQEYS